MKLIGIILKKSAWQLHDHLGFLILVNVLWCFSFFVVLPFPAVTIGIFYLAWQIADHRPVNWRDLWSGARQYFWHSWGLVIVYAVAYLGLMINIRFYLRLEGIFDVPGFFLSGVFFWLGIIGLLLLLYLIPVMTHDNATIWVSLKKSFWLLADNLALSLLLVIFLAPLQIIIVLLGITFILVGISWPAIVLTVATRELLRKYRPDQFPLPDDDIETRGWRDVFQPWTVS